MRERPRGRGVGEGEAHGAGVPANAHVIDDQRGARVKTDKRRSGHAHIVLCRQWSGGEYARG